MAKRRTARARGRKRRSVGDSYDTIADVAAKAKSDPSFFKAIIRGRGNVNKVLARKRLQLSPADTRTLKAGLRTIVSIAQRFKALGGWGRWPVMQPFK